MLNWLLHHPVRFVGVCFIVPVAYFTMLSVSLLVADLILFWASRCVIPSVLTPSIAEMMSPWVRLPPTALLPGVIYGGGNRAGHRGTTDTDSSGNTQVKNICSYANMRACYRLGDISECCIRSPGCRFNVCLTF